MLTGLRHLVSSAQHRDNVKTLGGGTAGAPRRDTHKYSALDRIHVYVRDKEREKEEEEEKSRLPNADWNRSHVVIIIYSDDAGQSEEMDLLHRSSQCGKDKKKQRDGRIEKNYL